NAARGGAATDGTRRPVLALRAVRRTQTAEAVALHDTGDALALALASDVDVLAGFEGVIPQLLADLVIARVVRAALREVAARRDVVLTQVVAERLVDLPRVDLPVAELDGGVAVLLGGADAGHHARTGLDHGHRNQPVVRVEDLGHAELLAQDALDRLSDRKSTRLNY